MIYCSTTGNMDHNHFNSTNMEGKQQKIESLLNDDRSSILDNIPHIVDGSSEQFRNHTPFNQETFNMHITHDERSSRGNPTEKEMQYIKRIYTLMALVSKQTKEIQSLRSIIDAYSQQDSEQCIHCNQTDHNRKRSKPT